MKTNKKLIGIALYLVCSVGFAVAQEIPDIPNPSLHLQEKRLPREVPNPEKIATQIADQMQQSLQLTDKQYKKIHKVVLKEQKEHFKAIQNAGIGQRPSMGDRPGMEGGHAHMDGMGMNGDQPPMMGEGGFQGRMRMGGGPNMQNNKSFADIQKKAVEEKDKKFKKILTTEQFEKWKAGQPDNRAKFQHERKHKENHLENLDNFQEEQIL